MMQANFKLQTRLIFWATFTTLILGFFTTGYSQKTNKNQQEEITEKRNENTKTYQLADGSYRAEVHGGAIHYLDGQDEWQDINTSVQRSSNPNYEFENTTNGIRSYFPKSLMSDGVKVATDHGVIEMGNSFIFSLDATLDAPVSQNEILVDLNHAHASSPAANVVRYDGGHSLGYVEYIVHNNQVKQQFILEQLPAAAAGSSARYFSMSETIELPQGWSLLADGVEVTGTASTQGALQIRNAQGKVVSGIPVPEIYEQGVNGSLLNPDGAWGQSYFVQQVSGTNQYLIKISIPMAWLQAPGRSFPIVIDPNSVLPGGWGGWIDGGNQTVNGNPSQYVFVGDLSGRDHMAYIQFLLNVIPDTVQVDSVLLSLYFNNQSSSASQVIEINDVKTYMGPYSNAQGQDSVLLDDFNNGTYTNYTISSGGANRYLGPINLGSQGASDLRVQLCEDTFQVAIANNNQSWKRFTSNLSSIDVYYTTCTGVAPTVVETFHQDQTCSIPLGSSTVMPSGGASIYWTHNGDTSTVQTGLAPGNYGVFVNDTSGCGAVLCITIEGAVPIDAVVNAIDPGCFGGSDGAASATVVGGIAPYEFQWSTSDTTSSISGLSPGTYSVIATDSSNCIDTTSFVIAAPTAVTISANGNNASCNGLGDGSATATATGGTGIKTFLWSSGDSTATASNLTAGTYYVTATDFNGCTAMDSVTITEPVGFSISTAVDSMVSCNGSNDGAATASIVSGAGTFIYTWSNSASTPSITGVTSGTYAVTITDQNSNCFKIDSVTITEPAVLATGISVSSHISCNGLSDGAMASSGSGGSAPYSYLWSTSDTTTSVGNLAAGTYSVSITDGNGCLDIDSITILEPSLLSVNASVIDNASCNGLSDGSASAVASGGTGTSTYLWSSSDSTATVTNLGAGTYTVIVTDSNACTSTDSITISEPAAFIATASGTDVSCNGLVDGSVSALVTSGSGPATYLWSTFDSTAAVSNLGAGTYTVVATDSIGCTSTDSITISEPAVFVASATGMNVSCNGLANGSVSALTTGGTGAANYLWNTSDSTAAISNLGTGTYLVVATDSNGCTSTDSVTISEPAEFIATASGTDASCNGFANGTASVITVGGTGIPTYLWSNSDTTASSSGLSAATYTVTAIDSNGCSSTDTVTISEPAAIDVTVTQTGNSLSANLSSVSYQWLDCNNAFAVISGETNQSFTALSSGNFAVEITTNGCADTSVCTMITVVGIEDEIASVGGFSLFPNPSTGHVMIRVTDASLEDQPVRIFSMTGHLVAEQLSENMDTRIDLSNLSNGVYVVQYRNQTKKLVLQK